MNARQIPPQLEIRLDFTGLFAQQRLFPATALSWKTVCPFVSLQAKRIPKPCLPNGFRPAKTGYFPSIPTPRISLESRVVILSSWEVSPLLVSLGYGVGGGFSVAVFLAPLPDIARAVTGWWR